MEYQYTSINPNFSTIITDSEGRTRHLSAHHGVVHCAIKLLSKILVSGYKQYIKPNGRQENRKEEVYFIAGMKKHGWCANYSETALLGLLSDLREQNALQLIMIENKRVKKVNTLITKNVVFDHHHSFNTERVDESTKGREIFKGDALDYSF